VPPFFFARRRRVILDRIFGLPLPRADASFRFMGRTGFVALALLGCTGSAHAVAPIHDPVALNIGINCQWHESCERRQFNAMNDARRYVAATHPPVWRIHMCNRNAARGPSRIDWVGFDDCIHNADLKRTQHRR
jgi:hypothetical protein